MKFPRAVLIVIGLWLAVILGVTIRGMAAPHQNSVFLVFRDAGRAWLAGQPLYAHVGKYLYSPLAAALFAPFALMPDGVASALWRLATGLAYLFAVIYWFRRYDGRDELPLIRWIFGTKSSGIKERPDERELVPTLGLALLLPLSIGNLNNGQASPLIIALLICGCLAALDKRWTLAAGCIAIATFFKIYPLAIGLLLAVIEPRKLTWRLILGVLILGILSLVLQRPDYVISQYGDWWRSLGADQRRVSTELGSWRDAWLLLRIAHVPITVGAYAILQAAAALAAACYCWWRSKRWNRAAVIWSAFSAGCLWITLFGPSTELATYIFLAPVVAFACAKVLTPVIQRREPFGWLQFLSVAAYGLLLLAEALNAWVSVIRQNNYLHAIQPVAALLFLGFVLRWNPLESEPSGIGVSARQ
ncbi:MAG TPA: glycosyltransferase family 87 protein [Chthoniobacterales bacterium]|nr:glycosyltransferase family 87 protein [Chthoniobacterales bacterium]